MAKCGPSVDIVGRAPPYDWTLPAMLRYHDDGSCDTAAGLRVRDPVCDALLERGGGWGGCGRAECKVWQSGMYAQPRKKIEQGPYARG